VFLLESRRMLGFVAVFGVAFLIRPILVDMIYIT
jgi:hypothetical protein